MSAYFANYTLYRDVFRFAETMPLFFVVTYVYCFTDDLTFHPTDGSALRAFFIIQIFI